MGPSRAAMMGAVEELVASHQPVMGTVLHLRIAAADRATAEAAERFVLDEARSLQQRLTWFDASSELSRWRAGVVDEPSPVLADLLACAARWQERSAGAFNPAAGVLSRRWMQAVHDGVAPTRDEMAALAATVAAPRFAVEDGRVRVLGDLADVNVNAVAKGFVVDRVATSAAERFGLDSILVNAGGDLRRVGDGTIVIGIEDPHRPYDNVAPLERIRLGAEALATSGSARRWFDVGGERYNQVLDPWTGWPVDAVASTSVVAPDAASADALATIVSVLPAERAMAFVDGVDGAAAMIVAADGAVTADARWVARRLRA